MNDIPQWREAADQLRLLGHPVRLALLDELSKGPKCVSDIQDLLGVRQANVSQHLAVLRQAKIVDFHEAGNLRCYYILRPGLVEAMVRFLRGNYPVIRRSAAWVRQAVKRRDSCLVPSGPTGEPEVGLASEGDSIDRAEHWNRVYTQKSDTEMSWYQAEPTLSLEVLYRLALPKDAAIIDVGGGGPSALAGKLLDLGFTCLTVLDVSAVALQRWHQRLGDRANRVTLLQADITVFVPPQQYDLWHDRAVFHFLTEPKDQQAYVTALRRGLQPEGHAVIATFAPDGPPSCSGLDVVRWEPQALAKALGREFSLTQSFRQTHQTPWGNPQAFVYCLFRRAGTPGPAESEQR